MHGIQMLAKFDLSEEGTTPMEDRDPIRTRYDGKRLDEIVASNANVHLEQMNDSQFALIIETTKERACFMVGAARANVAAVESWREPRKGRSGGQRRRWARLTPAQRKRRKR